MRQNLQNFLITNGKSKTAVKKNILDAIEGRNAICHSNLPLILNNWRGYLNSWVEVCLMIGSSQTASEIRHGLSSLSQPITNLTARLRLNPTVSAMTIFTNLANRSSLTTQQKEEAYLFLGDVFYNLITDSYSPALAEFAITRNYQCITSVIDCHELTKLIKSKCTANDFHSPHDSTCFNLSNIKIAADGRHAAVHEQKTKLLSDWDRYLGSMICVMKGIGAMSAAKTIGRTRSHLLRARDQAKRLVNSVQQSANPSGGQPIATTSRTTQTSRQRSTRRNKNSNKKIPAVAGVNP